MNCWERKDRLDDEREAVVPAAQLNQGAKGFMVVGNGVLFMMAGSMLVSPQDEEPTGTPKTLPLDSAEAGLNL